MPSDRHESEYIQEGSSSSMRPEYVDEYGRLMRGTEEVSIMEPAPHRLTTGDEVKGYIKEKWGRLVNDKQLEKEGLAIEKAAHPARSKALAEERLNRFLTEYNIESARRGPIDRRHTY